MFNIAITPKYSTKAEIVVYLTMYLICEILFIRNRSKINQIYKKAWKIRFWDGYFMFFIIGIADFFLFGVIVEVFGNTKHICIFVFINSWIG